jgi:hemolysin III
MSEAGQITTPVAQSHYSPVEENVHAGSHGAGLLLIAASDQWRIIASSIYGASLISLFLTSTLYHGLHTSRHRHLFKLLDHCAIYLVIAGTSTPFLVVTMRTDVGWWLFGAMWFLAAAGILAKVWHGHQYPRLSLASYLLMGWLMVIAVPELMDAIGTDGRWSLLHGRRSLLCRQENVLPSRHLARLCARGSRLPFPRHSLVRATCVSCCPAG